MDITKLLLPKTKPLQNRGNYVKIIYKNFLSLLLTITCISFTPVVQAQTLENNYGDKIIRETTEYYGGGSSLTVTITESCPLTRATYSKSGQKTYTYKNADNKTQWRFTVKGTFSVNSRVSASCTAASYSTSNIANG